MKTPRARNPRAGRLGLAALTLAAVVLAGCAARLAPAPEAARVDGGPGAAAVGEAQGVRIVARVNAWRGHPPDLQAYVTPLLVVVENLSSRRLRLRYEQFALVGPDGQTFAARAPFDIQGAVAERVHLPVVGPAPFYPYYAPFHRYHAFGWAHPFVWDPFYWDRFATRLVPLPTGDMVQKALPETAVEPGGRVSGFVYFERVRRVEQVRLRAGLVDAATAEPFGRIEIPFVLE